MHDFMQPEGDNSGVEHGADSGAASPYPADAGAATGADVGGSASVLRTPSHERRVAQEGTHAGASPERIEVEA